MEPPDEYHPEEQRTFIDKWSPAIFEQGNFTMVPNLLLKYAHELDITPSELVVLINIESFRWNTRPAFPSVERIAQRTGMSERHVTRLITSLVRKELMWRTRRRNRTNEYNFYPLIKKLDDIATCEPDAGVGINRKPDKYDFDTGHYGPPDADMIVSAKPTPESAKEYTPEKDEKNKTKKDIPRILNTRVIETNKFGLPVIDLHEIDF